LGWTFTYFDPFLGFGFYSYSDYSSEDYFLATAFVCFTSFFDLGGTTAPFFGAII
jgi:hypothetical protein